MSGKHFKLILPDEGFDIYTPKEGQGWGYRYGPSIMVHDGICEAWFASPGCAGEADWFTYRKSEDGGITWSDEKVVLMPTADSMDWFSVCDPGVIYYGGYYYIAYTSTLFSHGGGVCNNAFVARSRNAEGPYVKWTGSGWGETRETPEGTLTWTGAPAPILYFDEPWRYWGTGEPSLVVKDDVLYFYSTWTSKRADGSPYHMTRVATADMTRDDWPATLTPQGVATFRESGSNDSYDVVYCEDLDKFVAISTDKRFSKDSFLAIYESDDGLRFRRVSEIKANTGFMCHNSGISGDCLHHIKSGDLMLLGYAYGDQWGCWGTRFHRYTFTAMEEDFYSEQNLENVSRPVILQPVPEKLWPIAITSDPHAYKLHRGESRPLNLLWLDTMYRVNPVSSGIRADNFDRSVAEILPDGTILAKGVGSTYADVYAEDSRVQILIEVFSEDTDFGEEGKKVLSFEPLVPEYVIRVAEKELKEIRGLARYSDSSWFEVTGDGYTLEGDPVFELKNGCLTATGTGEAALTVSLEGKAFSVKVKAV